MTNYQKISDVKPSVVWRLDTDEDEINWLYGACKWNYRDKETNEVLPQCVYGLPVGKISIWMGEGGVGKSRLAIHLAKKVVAQSDNFGDKRTVLYFQNEVDLPTFASWVNSREESNFYCSNSTSLSEQIEIIRKVKPDLIIVDSINLIEGFGNGSDSKVKTIIDAYREVIKETNDEEKYRNKVSSSYSHVIFLCQLSKDGSAKGSTALTHLPDTTVVITKEKNNFKVAIGDKHRYGRTGSEFYSLWKHTDTGVECISSNRVKDSQWCRDCKYAYAQWCRENKPVVPKSVVPAPKKRIKMSEERYHAMQHENMDVSHIDPDPTMGPEDDEGGESFRRNYPHLCGSKKLSGKVKMFWNQVKRDTFKL